MFNLLRGHKRAPSVPTSPTVPEDGHSWEHSIQQPGHSHPNGASHLSTTTTLPERPKSSLATSPPQVIIDKISPKVFVDVMEKSDSNEKKQSMSPMTDSQEKFMKDFTGASYKKSDREWDVLQTELPARDGNKRGSERPQFSHTISAPGPAISQSQKSPQSFLSSRNTQGDSGGRPKGSRMSTVPAPSSKDKVSTFVEPKPPQKTPSKTRLNILNLNPMALLARRKSAQMSANDLAGMSFMSSDNNPPFNDPSIRGTKVHDFSAPRPRPQVSYDNLPELKAPKRVVPQLSDFATDGPHAPVFREDFDDEQYPATGPHVRSAGDLSDFVPPKPAFARDGQAQKELPTMPCNGEPETGTLEKNSLQRPDMGERMLSYDRSGAEVLSTIPLSQSTIGVLADAPPAGVARRNFSNGSRYNPAIPQHMKSTSSRFSFDMIGAATQEKLLEDRHREKAAEDAAKAEGLFPGFEVQSPYDDHDGFDYDDMMDDDGLEERIPGVNADYEDEDDVYEEAIPGVNTDYEKETTVVDSNATERLNTMASEASSMKSKKQVKNERIQNMVHLHASNFTIGGGRSSSHGTPVDAGFFDRPGDDDDDMYFDDGTFGLEDGINGGADFDETVFDKEDTDQYGRPLKNMSSEPTTANTHSPPGLTNAETSRRESAEEPTSEFAVPLGASNMQYGMGNMGGMQPAPSKSQQLQPSASLTQDSLNAHLQALEAYTQAAAASGRFERDDFTVGHFDRDDNHLPVDYEAEDDFDYEDRYEEDDIIAEANAEALAYDNDGYYNEEFGFYAAPVNTSDGAAENGVGGYFGPRGAAAITIQRNPSNVVREPNLTPITERSEYSNRNSVMSLPMSASSATNALGLAQIAGMLREQDGAADLSYDSLMKARNKAFGGNTGLLPLVGLGNSSPTLGNGTGFDGHSAGTAEGAGTQGFRHLPWQPQQTLPAAQFNIPAIAPATQAETKLEEPKTVKKPKWRGPCGEFVGDSPKYSEPMWPSPEKHSWSSHAHVDYGGSPLKPAGHGNALRAPIDTSIPAPSLTLRNSLELRPVSPNATDIQSAVLLASPGQSYFDSVQAEKAGRRRSGEAEMGRKHKASGSSESISYTKEEDPVQGERWVMERRRTEEGMEDEVRREVVRGGRI